MVGIHKEA